MKSTRNPIAIAKPSTFKKPFRPRRTIDLNPLSSAKGTKYDCEICGKPAKMACASCRVVYYCCTEHESADWSGIHEKICKAMKTLRIPKVAANERERKKMNRQIQNTQKQLFKLSKNESSKFIVSGKYSYALPGALQALRFAKKLYGVDHLEVVASYLLLGEANLGLGHYKVSEKFLSLANWNVFKNPECPNSLKSRLHRIFGKLYASQERHEEALKELAKDVYYCALDFGSEHIRTATGYYYLANVFLLQERIEISSYYFDKVAEIWSTFVRNLRKATVNVDNDINVNGRPLEEHLTELEITESVDLLKNVFLSRKKLLGSQHLKTAEVSYILGVIWHFTSNFEKSKEFLEIAKAIFEPQIAIGDEGEEYEDIFHDIQDVLQLQMTATNQTVQL